MKVSRGVSPLRGVEGQCLPTIQLSNSIYALRIPRHLFERRSSNINRGNPTTAQVG